MKFAGAFVLRQKRKCVLCDRCSGSASCGRGCASHECFARSVLSSGPRHVSHSLILMVLLSSRRLGFRADAMQHLAPAPVVIPPDVLLAVEAGVVQPPQRGVRRRAAQQLSGHLKRRRRNGLPADFWLYTYHSDGCNVVGLARVSSARQWAGADDREPMLLEQLRCRKQQIKDRSSCIVWVLDSLRLLDEYLVIPPAAAASWRLVMPAPLRDSGCKDLVASSGQSPSTRFFRVDAGILGLMHVGRARVLITQRGHLAHAGIVLPIADVGGNVGSVAPPTAPLPLPSVEVRENTEISRRHGHDFQFTVDAILDSLRLAWLCGKHVDLRPVLVASWRLTLPPAVAQSLEASLNTGILKVPGRSLMQSSAVKLDMLLSGFRAAQLDSTRAHRYIMIDSSPQLGHNILGSLEDILLWNSSYSLEEQINLDLDKSVEKRHLPLSCLGYGAADSTHKGENVRFCMLLECGGLARWDQYRHEIRAFTTDQGVEASVCDQPLHSPVELAGVVDKLRLGEVSFQDGSANSGFLYPYALRMPDHLHMIFGGLETIVTSAPEWNEVSRSLKSLSDFLSQRGLRERFVHTCVRDKSLKAALQSWHAVHMEFKWQYTHRFLEALAPVLPGIIDCFDQDKILTGSGDEGKQAGVEVNLAAVKLAAEAVRHKGLPYLTHVLRCVTKAADEQGSWCEGCWCHEAILQKDRDTKGPKQRARLVAEASRHCAWKGRRGPELVAGHCERMTARIKSVTDAELQSAYLAADVEDRARMKALDMSLRSGLCQWLEDKLSFWASLPFKIIGVFIATREGKLELGKARCV